MRIALINEVWTAGATRCARDLERGLAARHEVRYYPRAGKESPNELLADLTAFRPDVVHCHSYYGDLPYDFLATISRRFPICFSPHDPRPIGTLDPTCWECPHAATCLRCPLVGPRRRLSVVFNGYARQRLWKRWVHRRADPRLTLIVASEWLRQRLLAHELKRFTIHCVPYGIDLTHYRPIADARARLSLPAEGPVIFYLAHSGPGWYLNERKGLRYLADAFVSMVVPRFPDATLLIGGESLIPNHPRVRPCGALTQEQLPLWYSAADVLAMPTLADNLPYTILEAMACGTPVVASRVGGIPELVEEGVTGLMVPTRDPQALGMNLVSLLETRAKLSAMGSAARERAERLFPMSDFVRRHEEVYAQLTSGR